MWMGLAYKLEYERALGRLHQVQVEFLLAVHE
jgi:hypothetical protein